MGQITVRTEGVSRSIAALEALRTRVDTATMMATRESARTMQSTARGEFQGSHLPRFPHIGGPGSGPNVATDNLRQGILTFPTIPLGRGKWLSSTGPTAFYAKIIEFGKTITKTNGFMTWLSPVYGWTKRHEVTIPEYPYMRPAHRKMLVRMHEIFYRYWSGATRG